mgnify:FL=1
MLEEGDSMNKSEGRKGSVTNRRSIIMISVIAVLVIALAAVSLWALNLKESSAAAEKNFSLKMKSASDKTSEIQSEKNLLESENGKLKNEKDALIKENESLKKQVSEMADEKAAKAALKKETSASAGTVNNSPVAKGTCFLTFDDGPSANTLKILEILKERNAKATFFVTGNGDTRYIKNIYEAGHTVGLHTFSHNYNIYNSVDDYLNDLNRISDTVYNITGVRSNIIRFPGGSSNSVSIKHCRGIMSDLTSRMPQMGYRYFDWNVSSGDANSNTVPAAVIINNVLSGARNKNSICVLMHDNAAKTTTAAALPGIMDGLTEMGFHFEALTPESYGYHHGVKN